MSRYIFLSPHLDDVVLSCGAIVDHLHSTGHQTEIWTWFAGDPPNNQYSPFALSLHQRWQLPGNPILVRRQEDITACNILNTTVRHFDIPDCIYRVNSDTHPLITKEEDLYQPIPAEQFLWVKYIFNILNDLPPEITLVSPLSIGGHIDHRIVRTSVGQLTNKKILFYPDYPYNIKSKNSINHLINPNWQLINYEINRDNIKRWIEAIKCYTSQISTFWKNEVRLTTEILKYADAGGGKSLFLKTKNYPSL